MSDTPKTRMEQWVERMIELQKNGDIESAHWQADGILCEVLEYLGATRLVAEYVKVDKWYA